MSNPLIVDLRRYLQRHAHSVNLRRTAALFLDTTAILALCVGMANAAFLLYPWVYLPFILDAAVVLAVLWLVWGVVRLTVTSAWTAADAAHCLDSLKVTQHSCQAIALELSVAADGDHQNELVLETVRRALGQQQVFARRLPGFVSWYHGARSAAALGVLAATILWGGPGLLAYWDYPLASARPVPAKVFPGTVYVARGTSVAVSLVPADPVHPLCRLSAGEIGHPLRAALLRCDTAGVFVSPLGRLTHSVVYRFSLGSRSLGSDTIHVVDPPSIRSLQVTVAPPRYTGLETRALAPGQGNCAAYAGSRLEYRLGASFALAGAGLVTDGGDTCLFDIAGSNAQGVYTMRKGSRYRIFLRDTLGQRSDSLQPYYLTIIPDEAPLVRIVRPGKNDILEPEQVETLWVEGTDDLGVRQMGMQWFTNANDSVSGRNLNFGSSGPVVRSSLVWDLVPLQLYPGDTVYYWAWAEDGRPNSGLSRAVSDTFWFRVPGFAERHEMLAQSGEYAQKTMEEVRDQQEKLHLALEEMVQQAAGNQPMSWEQKQVLKDVQSRIDAQRDSLSSAVEALQEMVEQLKDAGLESDEILKKMDEVRKSLEELVENYGDSLLTKKQENNREISFDDLQQAVDRMKEMLPDLEQKLDNTLKYLDVLRKDQERLSLAQQMENLAQEQQRISQETDPQRQKTAQDRLLSETGTLSDKIRKASDPHSGDAQLFEPGDVPAMDQVDSAAQSMEDQLSQSSMPSQRSQDALSSEMMAAGQQMRGAMSSAMMERMMREQQRLLELAGDALTLSRWQEQSRTDAPSQKTAETAAQQQALIDGLRMTRSKLDSMGMVPPSMMQDIIKNVTNAAEAMKQAMGALGGGAYPAPMERAANGLNGAAQSMMQASGGMMCGQGGQGGSGMDGLSGMMRRLAGKQGAINAATADLLRQMLGGKKPGGTMSGGEGKGAAQALSQARKAQQALADQLKKLSEQYGNDEGSMPGGGKRLKELEQEARRLAKMLDSPTGDLRERQDRFLSRMLQSTLSVHREGEGKKKRKSKSAESDFSQTSVSRPQEGYDAVDSFERMRLRALGGNLPPNYRYSVKTYFDSLGVLFLKSDH